MGKKKNKIFLLTIIALLCSISAFALLKTGVFGNENNFLATDGSTRYDIVVDLGEGGKFEPSAKPEFTKMDNGKWIHKYQPSAKPVKLPRPVKDGYTFEGWLVEGDPTPKPEYSIPAWNKENINLSVKWKSATSDLLSGYEFNKKIKSMAGFDKVTEIKFINETPKLEGTDLSEKQNGYIKGSISGNVLTVACSGRIYASSNASNMFNGCSKLTKITLNNFDTSKVTTTGSMFSGCSGLTILDLGTFDTSKVLDMNSMFQECSSLTTIDVSKWDTSRVNSMYNMFNGCSSLELLDLSKLNISNVTDMCYMFSNCSKLTSEITISRVTKPDNISFMFAGCSSAADAKFIVKYTSLEAKEIAKQMVATKRDGVDHVYLYDPNYTLLAGPQFSSKVKTMLNFKNVTEIKFVRASANPDGIDLSEKQDGSIMGHIEGDVLTVVSQQHIFANPDCSGMFEGMSNIESITFENFDTSEVTNMSRMLNGCGADPANPDSCGLRTINGLDKFNTSKVANMDRMFAGCNSLKILNLSNFDTSKVTSMYGMFADCFNLNKIVGLENLNIQNVSDASCMFTECANLSGEITFTNPNMKIYHIFDSCSTNKGTMFIVKYENGCKTLAQNATIQVGQLNYRHVYLYGEDYMLDDGDTFNQVIKNIPNFDKVKHIKFVKGSPTTGEYVGRRHASCDMYEKNMNPTDPERPTEPPTGPTDPEEPDYLPSNFNPNYLQIICSKCAVRGNIEGDILYISAVAEGNIYASNKNGSMSNMFKGMPNIETITFDNFNTSEVYNMSNAFAGCTNLQSLDLSNFNTAKVKNMSGVFENCSNLETINLNNINMAKVTDTSRMFKNCSKLSGEMTINKSIGSYQEMFLGCSSDASAEFWVKYISPETKNVAKNMVATKHEGIDHVYLWEESATLLSGLKFQEEVKKLNLPDTVIKVAFKKGIPSDLSAFETIDVSEAKDNSILAYIDGDTLYVASDVKIMANRDSSYLLAGRTQYDYSKFKDNIKIIDISLLDTSSVINMKCMFADCRSLTSIKGLENFDTSNVINMCEMFYDCIGLESLDVSNFDTSKIIDISYMFYNCKLLKNLDVSNFDTSKVTNASNLFSLCSSLESIDGIGSLNTQSMVDISDMFSTCIKLTVLNLNSWDTNNITTMRGMFSDCRSLTNLDVSNFNTSEVTDMSWMFSSCGKLTSLDLSNFDTSKVTDMSYMFDFCRSLMSLDLSNFDTSKVSNMNYMFRTCENLSGEITIMNPYITNYTNMFKECSTLPSARFIVNYKPACKYVVQNMIRGNVVLGAEIQSVLNNQLGSMGVQKCATYKKLIVTPKPVKLTLINGPSAQYPKQVIQITNNKIPNLNAPDINPLYAGQFGGYYYDEQFTKPVKQGDIITRDLTIYARW